MRNEVFYLHPNEEIRQAQAEARDRAHGAVADGRVRWSGDIGPCGGFVVHSLTGHYKKPSLAEAIALHELRAAKVITVDKRGRAVLAAQKVSA